MKASIIAIDKGFNSQELANIMWGLSKAEFRDESVLSILSTEMRDEDVMSQSTPQEAANVIYALGKLNIRDEETFSCMNDVVMRDLDQATAQTIANVLWAHERVNIKIPQTLFNTWAQEKLDIGGLFFSDGSIVNSHNLEILED